MCRKVCESRLALLKGFTLIELLIVVIIISILVAIALPRYQQAIMKARYSGLIPIAKAVADEQEVYYMEHGTYATDITQLDILAPAHSAQAVISVPQSSDDKRFEYVLATRNDLNGLAYVIYQKYSEQFPGSVMCEANNTLNSNATWLCETALKGELVDSGSLQGDDWKAYLLTGEIGTNTFTKPSSCSGTKPADITASQSGAIGTAVCNEETGEYQYQWKDGKMYQYVGVSADSEYAYAGATFSSAGCNGKADYGCAGSTFVSNAQCSSDVANGCAESTFTGASCFGYVANACTKSIFTGNGSCNARADYGCAGAAFSDGGYCRGEATNGCAGAIFTAGGYCEANGYRSSCDKAEYQGGCCLNCSSGSGVPKCGSDKTWDGISYW